MSRKFSLRFFCLLLCACFTNGAFASTELGSWLQEASSSYPDSAVRPLFQKAEGFQAQKQTDSVLYYLELAVQRLAASEELVLQADLNLLLGTVYCNEQQAYDQAKPHLKAALGQVSQNEAPEAYLHILNLLTKSYYWKFEAEEAMRYAVEGLELAKAIQSLDFEHTFTQWVGRSFMIQGNRAEGLEYYERGLELALATDDPVIKYEAYLNLACGNYKDKKPKKGLKYLSNCPVFIAKMGGDEKLEADVNMWGGIMNAAIGNYDIGIQKLNAALPVFDRLNIPNRQMHTRLELGGIYIKERKNQDAIRVIEETLLLNPEKVTDFERKFSYTLLYQANKNIGKNAEALRQLEALNRVNAKLDSINDAKEIHELEKQFKEEEQKQIIEQQQVKERIIVSRNQWLGLALALVSLLLFGTFFGLYTINKNRKQLAAQNVLIENQAEELRKLDQLKTNFFANVSHELRTPLTLLLGPIGSALKSDKLDARNHSLLQRAQQSGQELMKMIGSILDLSKLEANKMDVQWSPELLFPLTRRIAAAFESQAQIKGIRYRFQYEAERDLYVEIDKNKLTIILNNLLSNALKFTPSDGEITFHVKDLGKVLQFKVQDTGRGIHPDDVPHVFDRFYQSKQTNTPVEGGTGIGLALCQEFAELMKGRAQVESELGQGSMFCVEIARREILGAIPSLETALEESELVPVPELATAQKSKAKDDTRPSIMIVEDNNSLRSYLEQILSPYYHVTATENGVKALEHLKNTKTQPQLILSDIMMPEMDGYQLLEKLKSTEAYRHIPTVMLTARADIQDKLKALRIGVDDYILKPFEEDELLARLENLLNNYQERRAALAIEEVTETEEKAIPSISQEDQAWLENLEKQLRLELSNNRYSITQLAYDLALSERQLRRRIKQLVGLSPSQYLK